MRAGSLLGLLAGSAAGFALGWLVRGGQERADVEALDARPPVAARSGPTVEAPAAPIAAPPAPPGSEDLGASAASRPRATALRADAPVLEGQGGPASWREDGWAQAALQRHYRTMSKGLAPPEEKLQAAVEQLLVQTTEANVQRTMEWWAEHGAQRMWQREHIRMLEGTLANPVEIVFQARGRQTLTLAPDPEKPFEGRSRVPLDLRAPATAQGQVYVKGGVIPHGMRLIVERADLLAFGSGEASRGDVTLELPGNEIHLEVHGSALEAALEGVSFAVREGDEQDVGFTVSDTAAELRLAGRLVPDSDKAPTAVPFRWTSFRGDGYVSAGRMHVQIAAGSNRAEVEFDAADQQPNERRERSDREVWDGNVPLKSIESTRTFVEGFGALPPGKQLEVTRISWKLRRLAQDSHSAVTVRLNGAAVLEVPDRSREAALERERRRGREGKEAEEETLEGSWTGSVVFRGDGGSTLQVEVRQRAMLDLRIEGTLQDVTPR